MMADLSFHSFPAAWETRYVHLSFDTIRCEKLAIGIATA
ncbi:MAG: hypothetical protein H6Q05_4193 [Acidobacteria bacterium]|nr:hypothetical protein [Acidobacteriota bacterium]